MEPNKFKKSVTSAETIDHIKAEGYEQELRSLLTKIFEKEKDSRHSIKIKDGIKYTFEKISSEI